MMTLDRQRDRDARLPQLFERRPRAQRPVVEALLTPFEPASEPLAVLPEVVQQPGRLPFVSGAEGFGVCAGPRRYRREVDSQGFPLLA